MKMAVPSPASLFDALRFQSAFRLGVDDVWMAGYGSRLPVVI